MTTVYLVRHAEAEGNAYRRIHGQYNSLITPNGLRQIEALRRRFEDIKIDACYASDLYRPGKTAQAVYLPKNLPLHPDARFRETGVGRWEDTPFGYLERFEKQDMDAFNGDEKNWHVDGSERWETYTARFLAGLDEVASRHEGQTIAIFSHACVLRGVQTRLLGNEKLPFCENTAVSRLCWQDGKVRFEFLNDASHLTPEISTARRQERLRQGSRERADYSLWFSPQDEDETRFLAMLRGKAVGELVLGKTIAHGAGRIETLALDTAFRGRRFGQQLLGQAVSVLRRKGARRIEVSLPGANGGARHFFEENGFTPQTGGRGEVALGMCIEVPKLP